MKDMKCFESVVVMLAVAMVMGSCGNKGGQQQEQKQQDSVAVADADRDSTVYGICGEGSAMNTLELITDIGDTLNLSVLDAKDRGQCFGGYQAGDRMAVMLRNRTTARLVINMSALLGEWAMPNPLDGVSYVGVRLKEGGVAESIDQPALNYRSWRIFNGQLELVAVREGGIDEEEISTYDFVFVGPDSLAIREGSDVFEYGRYKPVKYERNIHLEEPSESDFSM